MNDSGSSYLYLLGLISTIVFLLLAVFIVSFALLFQRRKLQSLQEKNDLKAAYEQAILKSQVEVQNQTLQRIGRELHDNIGQILSVIKLHISIIEESTQSGELHEQASAVSNLIDQSVADIRALSKSLDGNFVQDFGLVQSITHELDRLQKTRRYETSLQVEGEAYSLGFQKEIVVFRVVQEVLNNAIKHSGANRISIILCYQTDQLQLSVQDNGKGFDFDEALHRELNGSGAGLRNMQDRIQLIGGVCTFRTAPGQGTSVDLQLPLHEQDSL
ncbi:hypothetical protein GCM10023187_40740 [Nibrella viscosa]|uniref:Oxygen sensor histidine kinase NreB n=1 Tax=Nibrella viscosa TaxID=1084524 RepID=A0ABP8KRH9_9BACT